MGITALLSYTREKRTDVRLSMPSTPTIVQGKTLARDLRNRHLELFDCIEALR
jgi:hypothetical protein